ncbi:hypothetical protein C4565_09695 [Candidatus Parcubacteria bacterium]|jgi:hypothetical protein|nr:MAG: hypothetical protein C4565_09695 [Candidatus Parcubacteria bacterium]
MNDKSFAMQALVQLHLDSSLLTNKRNLKLRKRLIEQFGAEDTHLVVKVINLPEEDIISNGHPQKIVFNINGKEKIFSGVYFKRYVPKQTPPHLQAYEDMCKKKE